MGQDKIYGWSAQSIYTIYITIQNTLLMNKEYKLVTVTSWDKLTVIYNRNDDTKYVPMKMIL